MRLYTLMIIATTLQLYKVTPVRIETSVQHTLDNNIEIL